MTKKIYIDGMTCGNCAKHVEIAVGKLEGVESVKVDLQDKSATVTLEHPLDRNKLNDVIDDLGYKLVDIK